MKHKDRSGFLGSIFALMAAFLTTLGCSKDDNNSSEGRLSISAMAELTAAGAQSFTVTTQEAELVITDFLINLREVELEVDDDHSEDQSELQGDDDDHEGSDDHWDDDGYYDYEDEIELEGPFELDLLAGEIGFVNVSLPMGRFEELEFKIHKGSDPGSDLFGKSVLIRGTINGVPFIFWHDFEEEIEVDFEDPTLDIFIDESPEGILITFNLDLLLLGAQSVDLSQAQDGNNNGTIEISPQDEDGNNELAHQIRHRIKDIIDLLDD